MIKHPLAYVGSIAIFLVGCTDKAPDMIIAKQQISAQVNGKRACAELLQPKTPLLLRQTEVDTEGVRALAARNLIALRELREKLPEADLLSGDKPRNILVVPGTAGKASVRTIKHPFDNDTLIPQLCFGYYKVTRIIPFSNGTIAFKFRVIDAPPWTKDPAIRRAFPFMVRWIENEHTPKLYPTWTDGRWKFDRAEFALNEGIGKGFYACPEKVGQPSACN